eukprot:jgi/Chlat1/6117/Chrsp409S05657
MGTLGHREESRENYEARMQLEALELEEFRALERRLGLAVQGIADQLPAAAADSNKGPNNYNHADFHYHIEDDNANDEDTPPSFPQQDALAASPPPRRDYLSSFRDPPAVAAPPSPPPPLAHSSPDPPQAGSPSARAAEFHASEAAHQAAYLEPHEAQARPRFDDEAAWGSLTQEPVINSKKHPRPQTVSFNIFGHSEQQQQQPATSASMPVRVQHAHYTVSSNQELKRAGAAALKQPSKLVQALFGEVPAGQAHEPRQAQQAAELDSARAKIAAMEVEIAHFKRENGRVTALRKETEAMAAHLAAELREFERYKGEAQNAWEASKQEQLRKLDRDRRLLDKQARELMKIPNKKERSELEAMSALHAKEKDEARQREARLKATVERLKREVKDLTDRNKKLQETLEQQVAKQLQFSGTSKQAGGGVSNQLKSSTAGVSRGVAWEMDLNAFKPVVLRVPPLSSSIVQSSLGSPVAASTREQQQVSLARSSTSSASSADHEHPSQKFSNGTVAPSDAKTTMWKPVDVVSVSTARHSLAIPDVPVTEQYAEVPSTDFHGMDFAPEAAANPGSPDVVHPVGASGLVEDVIDHHNDGEQEEKPVQENEYPDGKQEKLYADGRKQIVFANGTIKVVHKDGSSVVHFTNGDIKKSHNDARIEYYYQEVDTWHTMQPDGVEVFKFPSGQVETHWPDGRKEIVFPDGTTQQMPAD